MTATYRPSHDLVTLHSPLDHAPIARTVDSRSHAEAYAKTVAEIYNCSVRLVSDEQPHLDLGTFYPHS